MNTIEDVDALIHEERFHDARTLLEHLARGDVQDEWAVNRRRAQLDLRSPVRTVAEVALGLEEMLEAPPEVSENELGLCYAYLARCYSLQRCRPLAEALFLSVPEFLADHPRILIARGRLALDFDDRVEARRLYERALSKTQNGYVLLALADLEYTEANFDASLERLSLISSGDYRWPRAQRLAAFCYSARGELHKERDTLGALVEAFSRSDLWIHDRIAYALSCAACDDVSGAIRELQTILDSQSASVRETFSFRATKQQRVTSAAGQTVRADEQVREYVRERLRHLQYVSSDGRRASLPAFPTTRQKWDYCGPAALEICLRYLDVSLTQEEIAAAVKREHGTPMHNMMAFLAAHGITARRVEMTVERLKAAVDLGLPVIVQEELSTNSHVSVVTGYDERLGVFVAHDPASHRPVMKSFEWLARAGRRFSSAGILVMGRHVEASLERRCDEAGLVPARHVVMVDAADEVLAKHGTSVEAILRAIDLCTQAIRVAPSYKFAWERRVRARMKIYEVSPSAARAADVLDDMVQVRTRFARDEWVHQVHAHWLFLKHKPLQAYVEFNAASRIDPSDADNLQSKGECLWLLGDLAGAERGMLDALMYEPHHVRAIENLAAIYLRQIQALDKDVSLEDVVGGAAVKVPLEHPPPRLYQRAEHFSRLACALNPRNVFNYEVAGELAARRGLRRDASEAFAKAYALMPSRRFVAFSWAKVLVDLGEYDKARSILEATVARHPESGKARKLLGELYIRLGEVELAAHTLSEGLTRVRDERSDLIAPLLTAYASVATPESAAGRLWALAKDVTLDAGALRELAAAYEAIGADGYARMALERVLDASPSDVVALYRLGVLFSEDPSRTQHGRNFLIRVIEILPQQSKPRVALAIAFLEDDPQRGLAVIESAEMTDPFALETKSSLQWALGDVDAADETFARASRLFPSAVHALVSFLDWHLRADRVFRASTLLHRLHEVVVSGDVPAEVRRKAEAVWLRASRLCDEMENVWPTIDGWCRDGVPTHLAYELFLASTGGVRPSLAKESAGILAGAAQDESTREYYRIAMAVEDARLSDHSALLALEREEASPERLAQLSEGWLALGEMARARDAAALSLRQDPDCLAALVQGASLAIRARDFGEAAALVAHLGVAHPYEHVGLELDAMWSLRSGQPPRSGRDPVRLAERAVEIAPNCPLAHALLSAALVAARRWEEAAVHAQRSKRLAERTASEVPDDAQAVLVAVRGDFEKLSEITAASGIAADSPSEYLGRLHELAELRGRRSLR